MSGPFAAELPGGEDSGSLARRLPMVLSLVATFGPTADLEAQARAVLHDFEHEGYSGAAAPKIRKLVDDASLVGRATAGWDQHEDAKA